MISLLLLVIIYITFISLGLPDTLLGSAWPVMYSDLGVRISMQGILSITLSAMTVLSSFSSGYIMRKFKMSKIIFTSVLMTAIAILGFSVSHNFWLLCLLVIPLGLGAGCIDSCLNSFVAECYKPMHMNWLHCFWGIGATAGPMILSAYLKNNSWQGGYRIIGIIQISITALLLFAMPLWEKVRKSEAGEETSDVNPTYLNTIKQKGVISSLFAFYFYGGVEQVVGLWGASYITLRDGLSASMAAKIVAVYFMGIAIGRFISGFLTIKLSNRRLIYIGTALVAVATACLSFTHSASLIFVLFAIIGLGAAPIFPSMVSETPHRFKSAYSQSVMGMQMAAVYLGIATLPPFFGILAREYIHIFPQYVFICNALLVAFTILIYIKKGKEQ